MFFVVAMVIVAFMWVTLKTMLDVLRYVFRGEIKSINKSISYKNRKRK